MDKRKLVRMIFAVLAALDLVAILAGAAKPDAYLRPLALLAALAVGVLSLGGRRPSVGAVLILLAVLLSAPLEFLQKMNIGMEVVVMGTTAIYGIYILGIVLANLGLGTRKRSELLKRFVLPFLVTGVYTWLMFLLLNPYGPFRVPALLHMLVVSVMVGVAALPFVTGDRGATAWLLLGGATALLVSDTLRAVALFKLNDLRGGFLVDQLLEAVILALFFAGHFCFSSSVGPDQEEATSREGSPAYSA